MKSMKPQGYADAATPAEGGRALAGKIKGASYHLISDGSHLCNLGKPETFVELLYSHLVA